MEPEGKIKCERCLMPFEERFINENGECVICHEHRKKWLNKDYGAAEEELVSILEHYKKRNRSRKYDAIVAFSGGKDSVFALYLAKEKFGMRPIAVTADNGLLTERAVKNMKTITDRLGVEHLIVNRDHEELKALYRAYFQKTRNFCEICYLTIMSSLVQTAIEYDVPLIITGYAFKVDSSHFRASQRYCFEDAFANTVKDTIPAHIYGKYLTKGLRSQNHFHVLHLFDYVNHVEEEIYRLLEEELGWDSHKGEDKHGDCRFYPMLGYLKYLRQDYTSLALMTPAGLLRDGQIAEEKFHRMLEKEKKQFQNISKEKVVEFCDFFGVEEEFLGESVPSAGLSEPVIAEDNFKPLIEARERSEKSQKELVEMLVEIVRPEVTRDGGDIKIAQFDGKVLKIVLSGACRGCVIADQVLIRYLEYLMRKYVSGDLIIENFKEVAP